MNRINWLFFDLGTTLVDETACYNSRIDYAVQASGIRREEFVHKVCEYAKTSALAFKSAVAYYGVALPKWNNDLERLYPGVKQLLHTLSQRYKLGIIANQAQGTKERLENWGIRQYFDVIVASAEEGCEKPDPKIYEIALSRAKCAPEEAVMIGDRLDNDIVPAKRLGMKTVWVKQGFARFQCVSDEIEKPDYTVDTIPEVLDLFCGL